MKIKIYLAESSSEMPDEADCSICSRLEDQEDSVQIETNPVDLERQDELIRRLSVPKINDDDTESEVQKNLDPEDNGVHCRPAATYPFDELQEESEEDIADDERMEQQIGLKNTSEDLMQLDDDEVFLLDENLSTEERLDTECTRTNETVLTEVDEYNQNSEVDSSVQRSCKVFETNPQLSVDIKTEETVNSRRRFFESLSESQKSPSISLPERPQRSSSFRKAKDFWECATSPQTSLSLSLSIKREDELSKTEDQKEDDLKERSPIPPRLIKPLLFTPTGSDGDSGIHVSSFRHRSRSDPGQPSAKRCEDRCLPFFYRTNPLFMLEPGAFASDQELTASTPTTLDDRGFIDDEIPDYAAHFMGGGYVSFTGLLDGDRLMSRRELLMGLEGTPMTSGEEEFFLPRSEKCRAIGAGLHYGQVGMRNQFQVRTEGAGKGFLTVSVQGAGDHDVIEVITTYTGQDTYEVMYEVTEPGYYIISIKWSEWNVPESPFICKVTY